MANSNPPKKNQAFTFWIGGLEDYNNPGMFKLNPTLASGDLTIQGDGGSAGNPTTGADVDPDSGYAVKITLTAGEMNYDSVVIRLKDQTSPPEWCDWAITILTTA